MLGLWFIISGDNKTWWNSIIFRRVTFSSTRSEFGPPCPITNSHKRLKSVCVSVTAILSLVVLGEAWRPQHSPCLSAISLLRKLTWPCSWRFQDPFWKPPKWVGRNLSLSLISGCFLCSNKDFFLVTIHPKKTPKKYLRKKKLPYL